jgi:hypothetical protein
MCALRMTLAVVLAAAQQVPATTTEFDSQPLIIYGFDDPQRLQLNAFSIGYLRHNHEEGENFIDSLLSLMFGSMPGGITFDFINPQLSDNLWKDSLGIYNRTWNLKQRQWSEVMVLIGGNDEENDTITIVANRRPTESEMRTALDAWMNEARRSQIEYLKLSCLQRSQNYDFNMCSCTNWKLKTQNSVSISNVTANSKKTADAYEVVDSDMLCEDQFRERLTADMFDGFDGA